MMKFAYYRWKTIIGSTAHPKVVPCVLLPMTDENMKGSYIIVTPYKNQQPNRIHFWYTFTVRDGSYKPLPYIYLQKMLVDTIRNRTSVKEEFVFFREKVQLMARKSILEVLDKDDLRVLDLI